MHTAAPQFSEILHATDFSEGEMRAFAHSLRIALAARATLTLLHISSVDEETDWSDFPHVRTILEQWGQLQHGSNRADVAALGLSVEKMRRRGDSVDEILAHLSAYSTDLLVFSNHQRRGWDRFRRRHVSLQVSRRAGQCTLFVPRHQPGFVSLRTGQVRLADVLIPAATTPDPSAAIQTAHYLAGLLGVTPRFTLLHVGEEQPALAHMARRPGEECAWLCRRGPVVDTILSTAEEQGSELIVMATEGTHSFMDSVLGSTAERIVHEAPCPVLAVPVALLTPQPVLPARESSLLGVPQPT